MYRLNSVFDKYPMFFNVVGDFSEIMEQGLRDGITFC